MYGIYSELSNFDEIEFTKKDLKDQLERDLVNPSETALFRIASTSERLLKLLDQQQVTPYLMRWKIPGGRATVTRELNKVEDIEYLIHKKDLMEGGVDFEIVKWLPLGGYKQICGITIDNDDLKENNGTITPE